jgi:thiamine-phosphate pyrophosphorylase
MTEFPKGIYLVVDPQMETDVLFENTRQALEGGVNVFQIWNNWPESYDQASKVAFINQLLELTNSYNVPVLINNEWELMRETELAGVHFDEIPADIKSIRLQIPRTFYVGITCGNDRKKIRAVQNLEVDYISFCSMFPSSSVDTCEIVNPDNVAFARLYLNLPIFVSGGITPNNASSLMGCGADGIAVISGILNAENPKKAAEAYQKALKHI